MAKLQEEIETYRATGDLDMVFKKYCRKSLFLSKCVSNFGKENMKLIQNLTDSLLSFVRFREGNRIALFVSVNGPECLQSKQQEIQQCVITTFGSYIPVLGPNNGSLAGLVKLLPLVFGFKECTHIHHLSNLRCDEPGRMFGHNANTNHGFYIRLYFLSNAVPGFID